MDAVPSVFLLLSRYYNKPLKSFTTVYYEVGNCEIRMHLIYDN